MLWDSWLTQPKFLSNWTFNVVKMLVFPCLAPCEVDQALTKLCAILQRGA